jgi:hypothetical protein
MLALPTDNNDLLLVSVELSQTIPKIKAHGAQPEIWKPGARAPCVAKKIFFLARAHDTKKNIFVRSYPSRAWSLKSPTPLSKLASLSLQALSLSRLFSTLSRSTTSSPFFLLSPSLLSPSSLLILSSHLFARLGSNSTSSVSLSAGTAFLARSGRPLSRSTCVP